MSRIACLMAMTALAVTSLPAVASPEEARELLAGRLRADELELRRKRWIQRLREQTYVEVRLKP